MHLFHLQFKETCDFELENANVATGFLFNLWCCGFIIRTAGRNSKFTLFDQKPAFIFQNLQFGKPWRGNVFLTKKQSNTSTVIWHFLYLSNGFADLLKTRVGLAEGPEISAINCVLWLQRGLALASWQPTICSSSSSSPLSTSSS